jgi:hypothetical protein
MKYITLVAVKESLVESSVLTSLKAPLHNLDQGQLQGQYFLSFNPSGTLHHHLECVSDYSRHYIGPFAAVLAVSLF